MSLSVFCDFHHYGTYAAILMLFEGRLGHSVYRPIGYDWLPYWRVQNDPPQIDYYLDPKSCKEQDGHYTFWEKRAEVTHKCVSLEQFMDMDIDVILQTHPGNEATYHELWKERKPKAKFIRWFGNPGEIMRPEYVAPNVIDTVGYYERGTENYVHIHQEFPLDAFEKWTPPSKKRIGAYAHHLRHNPYGDMWDVYKEALPEFEWVMYGEGNDDGYLCPISAVHESMKECMFVWNMKEESYGFNFHNAMAAGKPVICYSRYDDRPPSPTIEPFMKDGECIVDILGLSLEEAVEKIRIMAEPDYMDMMSWFTYQRFGEVVDFDEDERKAREFVERLR